MSPIYTSIDPSKEKALFKNQRVRRPAKPKKDERNDKFGRRSDRKPAR